MAYNTLMDSAACQNLPTELITRLHELFGDEAERIMIDGFAQPRATTFRVNRLKATPAEVQTELTSAGFGLENVPWYPDAFILRTGTLRDLETTSIYQSGKIYVQTLSSMLPPLILNPESDQRVLDIAAAPGSKTSQLATMMNNTGEILANDISRTRVYKLRANLERLGVTNTRTQWAPGENLWRRYPEYFEKTLVDVPCTMEGRIQCDQPDTFDDWSIKKMMGLTVRQCHLLRAAVTATQVGGEIVYATCTMAPEENEHVVNWLLQKEAGKVEVVPITLPATFASDPQIWSMPGFDHWQQEAFDPSLQQALRILPTATMEGFFVVRLRKVASTLPVARPRFSTASHQRRRF